MKKQLYLSLMAAVAMGFASCQTDVSLDDLQMKVANNFFDTYVTLVFEDASTGEILETGEGNPIQVTIAGPDQSLVMTDDAKRKNQFTVDGGILPFALDPYAKVPSAAKPVHLTVTATGSGFLPVSRQIDLYETGINKISILLIATDHLPEGVTHQKTENFTALVEGKVPSTVSEGIPGTGVNLELREGTVLKTAAGTPLNGPVSVELTHFDTRAADPSTLYPGGITGTYTAENGSSETGLLAPAGWIDIEIKDANGNVASKVESGTIGLTLPVNANLYNPATNNTLQSGDKLKLMSFEPATASWKYEGEASYSGGAMKVELPHLSTWSLTAATSASNLTFHFTSEEYDEMKSYFNFNFSEATFQVEITPTGGSSTVMTLFANEGSNSAGTLLPAGTYTATFTYRGTQSQSAFKLPDPKSFTVEAGTATQVDIPLTLIDNFTVLHGTLSYKKSLDPQESIGGNVSFRFRNPGSPAWRYVTTGPNGELSIQLAAGEYEAQVSDQGKWKPKEGPQSVDVPADRLLTIARLSADPGPLESDLLKNGITDRVTLTPSEILLQTQNFVQKLTGDVAIVKRMLKTARTQNDVVRIICLTDKFNQMGLALSSARDRQALLQSAINIGDISSISHQFKLISLLNERADYLLAEAKQCLGEGYNFNENSHVVFTFDPNQPDPNEPDNNNLNPPGPKIPLSPLTITTSEGVATISFVRPPIVAPHGWVKR